MERKISHRTGALLVTALWLLMLLSAGVLFGQLNVGKIEGTVRDKDSGNPLAGVQVIVEGTRQGNVTNADGYYFILNVSPGRRSIVFTFTGYQKTTVAGQLILAGQTTTVDARLSGSVVEMEGIVIEGQSEVLMPRDNTATKHRLTTAELISSPNTTLQDLLVLEAGVQIGGEGGMSRGLRIRGGRLGEEAMMVDGVLARNFTAEPMANNDQPNSNPNGNMYSQEISSTGADSHPLELATGSVEEVDVITGGFQAEYGNAQSGIINIVTKEGGPEFRGNVRYTTDMVMPITSDWGYNQLQTGIGGPIPLIPNLFFNVSGEIQSALDADPTHADEGFRGVNQEFVDRLNTAVKNDPLLGSQNPPYTLEMFRNGYDSWAAKTGNTPGLFTPGNPVRLPDNWKDRSLLSEKLVYNPLPGLKVILSDNYSRNQRSYPVGNSAFSGGEGNYFLNGIFTKQDFPNRNWKDGETQVYVPQSYARRTRTYNMLAGFDWDFLKSSTHSGALQFRLSRFSTNDVASSSLKTNYRREDNTTLWGWSLHDIPFEIESYPNWEIPTNNVEAQHLYLPDGLTHGAIDNPYNTPFGMVTENWAYWLAYFHVDESQWNYKGDLDFQLNRENRAKLGLQWTDFKNRELEIHGIEPRRLGENGRNEFNYRPRMLGAYLQNRTDLGDFIFDYGIRYDWFDPVDNWGRRNGDNLGDRFFVKNLSAWSPRFNVAFPVTDRSQLRFSYGTFSQVPGMTTIFTELNPGNLKFSRTQAFETGISFLPSNDVVLDLVAFYRDIDGNVTQKTYFRDYYRFKEGRRIRDWETGFTNGDIGNIKGFDLTLQKKYSNSLALNLAYTMQFSRATGSNIGATPNGSGGGRQGADNDYLDATTNETFTPPDVLWPNDGDRTHEFSVLAQYLVQTDYLPGDLAKKLLKDVNLNANFSLKSGQPLSDDATLLDSDLTFLMSRSVLLNHYRGHWYYNLDLRVNKSFSLGKSRKLNFYSEIFNLLNRKNSALYPSGYQSKEYLNVAGGVDLNWNDPSLDQYKRARFKNDYNQDGILTVEEQAKGAIAQQFMLDTMNKRRWGIARQVRFGLDLNF
ncbi:TonB-dependent receptor [bacterium]|nr:TonB-dependent receptor [bacterium]